MSIPVSTPADDAVLYLHINLPSNPYLYTIVFLSLIYESTVSVKLHKYPYADRLFFFFMQHAPMTLADSKLFLVHASEIELYLSINSPSIVN